MEQNMVQTITVVILAIIAFAAGIWSWWFTNHDNDTNAVDSDDTNNNEQYNQSN